MVRMGIDMSAYKMIYQDKVYNCVNMEAYWVDEQVVEHIRVFFINEDNRITMAMDEVSKFQFISK